MMPGRGRPKGSSGINKSKLIREFMESHPEATNKEIIDSLSSQGVEVSAALVGGVRNRSSSIKSKEITIGEINNIRAIVERFEDESIIMGIIDDLTDCIKKIGGIPRFQAALAQLKGESDYSDSDDSDSDEDSEMPESDSETVSVTASTSEYDYQDEDDEEDED